jgi:hypothetical protein
LPQLLWKKLTEGSKARNQEKDSADDSDFYIRTFAYRDALNPPRRSSIS